MENGGNTEKTKNTEIPEKKSHSVVLWTVIILLVVCILGIGGTAVAWKRLAQLAQATPLVNVGDATVTVASESLGTTQPGPCGRSDQQIIMLLAYDTKLEPPYGSDGMRLLKVDYASQRIQLLALPRGLWVLAPQEVQPTLQATSLGELYQYGLDHGGQDLKQARSYASHLVAQALFENFQVASNNFAVLETETFSQMVDTLGGIDVTLPATTTLNGQVYYAGTQHWNGNTTLQYVRALPTGENDWDRFSRQNLVLQAIKSAALSTSGLTQIPDLLGKSGSGLTTDLNLTDVENISCLARQNPGGQVQAESLPIELVSQGPGTYLIPNYDAMTAYLQKWMSGQ